MMNSKERVIKTLNFDYPDKIPVDFWCLPSAEMKYGEKLKKILNEVQIDFVRAPFDDPTESQDIYKTGTFKDVWGSVWHNLQDGIIGEVKTHPLDDYHHLKHYKTPKSLLLSAKDKFSETNQFIKKHQNKFIFGGWINIFERMQFLRGTENLYIDLALDSKELYTLRDMVVDYYREYLKLWLKTDVDAIIFADDWGSQKSLLISPKTWKKVFKPVYKELFDMAKNANKYVFMHSDGYILDLYDEFIDLGVDAINSQIWCMGVKKVSSKCKGKITLWGELNRQETLPHGKKEDIEQSAKEMIENLYHNGGLIGQFEAAKDMPLENIKTALTAWNK